MATTYRVLLIMCGFTASLQHDQYSTKFHCDSGELIPRYLKCDGVSHCPDDSDEDQRCFQIQCPSNAFRCSYGACIDPDYECDGKTDCRDNSDETTPKCLRKQSGSRCTKYQFECSSGQCIPIDAKCDGMPDCNDNSDETLATCWRQKCPGYTFRCNYGACVDGTAACNGTIECFDGSDEQPHCTRVNFTATVHTPKSCILPTMTQPKKLRISGMKRMSIDLSVPSGTYLTPNCSNRSMGPSLVCNDGTWIKSLKLCQSQPPIVINLFINSNVTLQQADGQIIPQD